MYMNLTLKIKKKSKDKEYVLWIQFEEVKKVVNSSQ